MRTNYRYYISFLLLLLIIPLSKAQEPQIKEIWELNGNESSESKIYVARESIKLQSNGPTAGFSFQAGTGKSFSAKIDAGLLFPPTDKTYMTPSGDFTDNPSEGAVVGSIPGQFAVSPTGAASYTIPIEVPAGINGMQPNISLVYNSQGGNGILGWGWNISGISGIGKACKTIYNDNAISPLDLSLKEKYTLDGTTLLHLSGIYGDDNATYQTETKTYSSITSIGQSNSTNNPFSNTYPLSFKVISKDGIIIEYGIKQYDRIIPISSSYPIQPIQWLISKQTDANGNSVEYNYKEEAGIVPTIQSITYSDLSINFSYEIKSVIKKIFVGRNYLNDKYILKKIEIKSNGVTIRTYDLNYTFNSQKQQYFFQNIVLSGLGNEKLNPTKIDWGIDKSIGQTYQSTIPFITNAVNQSYAATDIDGDGRSELIHFYEEKLLDIPRMYANVYECDLEQNKYKFSHNLPKSNLGPNFSINTVKGYNGGLLFCDFNGDGKKTIISPSYYENTTSNEHSVSFLQPTTGLGKTHYLNNYSGISAYVSGDINNDGIDEIISIEKALNGANKYAGKIFYVSKYDLTNDDLFDGDQDPYQDHWLISDVNISRNIPISTKLVGIPKRIIISDFNNDGLKDLFIITDNGYVIYKNTGGITGAHNITEVAFEYYMSEIVDTEYSTFEPGDFNGDGLVDFIINEHCNSTWKLAINNGISFTYKTLTNISAIEEEYTPKNNDIDDCIVTDFNHDGKSDIIIVDAVYSKHHVWPFDPWGEYENTDITWYTSTGTSFTVAQSRLIEDETFVYSKYITTGDFNGDGKEDVLSFGSDIYYGFSKSKDFFINSTFSFDNIGENFEANQVVSIVDGMGKKTEIDYQPLTFTKTTSGADYYTKGEGANYPVADIIPTINCVIKASTPIDENNNSITEYFYSGAKVHATGKGFLGFSGMSYTNASQNIKISSLAELEFPYCLPKTRITVSEALTSEGYINRGSTNLISKTVSTFTNTKNTDGTYVTKLSKVEETDYLNILSKITEYLEYENGSPKKIKITEGDLKTLQEIQYGQFGSWAWCTNKPVYVTTTKTLTGSSEGNIRKASFDYDDNTGILTEEILDPEDAKNKLTTTYSNFDNWGHAKTITVSTPGRSSRISHIKYTDSGRFIDYKINHLDQKTDYEWDKDEVKGLLISETDYQNNRTLYSYNGFGQLTETVLPTGIRKANSIQWAESGNSYGAKYYLHTEISGEAPIKIWYDNFGREIVKQSIGLNDKTINVFTKYLSSGKIDCVSEPTFASNVSLVSTNEWTAKYTYEDVFGRITQIANPEGNTYTEYYPNDRATVVIDPNTGTLTTLNNYGKVSTVDKNGKIIEYTYYPSGLTKTSGPQNESPITLYYDLQGNRTKIDDPDAGITENIYNGFGELIEEKQLVHGTKQQVKTTNNYFNNGLLNTIVRENIGDYDTPSPTVLNTETTSYIYDTEPNHTTRVKTIKISDNNKQTFGYDKWDRVTSVEMTVGNKVFNRKTEYDFFGRVKKDIYPSGFYTVNTFDNYGNLTETKDGSGTSIWKVVDVNAKGQVLHTLKGGDITTSYEYYDNGFLKRFSATDIVDMEYVYDGLNNLYSREDKKTFQKEVFGYDDFNRLTNWNVTCNGVETAHSLTYDGLNIQSKSDLLDANEDLLTLNYGEPNPLGASNTMINATPGPHALTSISGEPTNFPANNLSITYTDFKKIKTLTEGNKIYELSYGVDDQRSKSVYKIGSTVIQTRYYVGDYEEEYDQNNKFRKIHYLSGAIYIDNEDKPDSLYYTFSDYQGSVIAITDNEGTVKRRFAYDPWGQRRNPTNWNESDNLVGLIVNRGYTSHEHLDAFGIINMNGRVYDPLTAQFLSPDPYVQSPDSWVNYNRYGYCFGNPLKYTDPSGYYTGWDDAAALLLGGTINLVTNWHDGITPLEAVTYFGNGALTGIAVLYAPEAAPAIIAASGALNDLTRQSFQSDGSVNFDNVNWGQVAFSGMMSGLTSVVGGQVGQALHINTWFSSIESTLLRNVLQSTTTNLIVSVPLGGFTEYSNGGDFWEGAWSGAKMGLITGTISGIGNAATYSLNNKVDFLSGKSLKVSSYQKGQNGVQRAIWDIQNQGGEVLGTEVTFDVNGVRTRVDIVANIDGVVTLTEVKNGPFASFTTNQKAAYKSILIDQARPIPVGGNAFKAGLIVGQPLNNFQVRIIKYW